MALQNSAMLVSLTLTQWSARKLDRNTSYEVCKAKHADQDLGRFNKQIVPKKYLKNIQQLSNRIRNFHYSNTLPWQHKGSDLLPGRHYMKYAKRMGELKEKFNEAVNEFLTAYPTVIKQVQNNLNDLYDDTDYPTVEQIRKKFTMDIKMTPVPSSGDFRIDINQKELDKLKTQLDEQIEQASKLAQQELFSRLYSSLAKAVLTLRIPGKIFRNTLILNIEDICRKIPTMNFNDNERLDSIAELILNDLARVDMDELRDKDDISYRLQIADQLEVALKQVEQIYLGADDSESTINTSPEADQSPQQAVA
jgi:hypothetical protein